MKTFDQVPRPAGEIVAAATLASCTGCRRLVLYLVERSGRPWLWDPSVPIRPALRERLAAWESDRWPVQGFGASDGGPHVCPVGQYGFRVVTSRPG